MTAAIATVFGVALALFLACIALAYIAAVGARRAQAVEDEALRDTLGRLPRSARHDCAVTSSAEPAPVDPRTRRPQ